MAKIGAELTQVYSRLRNNLDNVATLYKLPPAILPFAKWGLHEISSHLSYGKGDMPQGVGIETISVCNRACTYCSISKSEFRASRENPSMSMDLYKKIVSDLSEAPRVLGGKGYNGNLFLFAFGEPTLDKLMPERVKIAREGLPEANIQIFSNGDRLNAENLRAYIEAGVNRVFVTPHDKDIPKPPHIDELLEDEEFAKVLVLGQPLQYFVNRAGTVDGIAKKDAIYPEKRCISNTYVTYISSDGKMSMCAHDAYLEAEQGNLKNDNFWQIWDKNKEVRSALRKGDWEKTPEICTKCRTHFDE